MAARASSTASRSRLHAGETVIVLGEADSGKDAVLQAAGRFPRPRRRAHRHDPLRRRATCRQASRKAKPHGAHRLSSGRRRSAARRASGRCLAARPRHRAQARLPARRGARRTAQRARAFCRRAVARDAGRARGTASTTRRWPGRLLGCASAMTPELAALRPSLRRHLAGVGGPPDQGFEGRAGQAGLCDPLCRARAAAGGAADGPHDRAAPRPRGGRGRGCDISSAARRISTPQSLFKALPDNTQRSPRKAARGEPLLQVQGLSLIGDPKKAPRARDAIGFELRRGASLAPARRSGIGTAPPAARRSWDWSAGPDASSSTPSISTCCPRR